MTETTKPDLALQHWMDAEITLKTHNGQYEEKLTIEQFAYIIKRINEVKDDIGI